MREHRLLGAASLALTATLLLSGCIGPGPSIVTGSEVNIGSNVPFTSMNPQSHSGDTDTNIAVAAATGARFFNFDETAAVVFDPSFGSVTKLSDDPLVVRYTVADGVRWSDGVAVDGADLLLNWAALSGVLNDPELSRSDVFETDTDADTEDYRADLPDDAVYFDTGVNPERPRGIQLARAIPQLSDDRKSITMTYSAPFADWAIAMPSAGSPAHVAAGATLDIEGSNQAKDAVIAAVLDGDVTALGPLSKFWNTGFSVAALDLTDNDGSAVDDNLSVLVSNGPYLISDILPEQFVTLAQNPNYVGAHRPEFETVTFRYFRDPLASIQGLNNGAVQVATPPLTESVVSALEALRLDSQLGYSARFEHLDLRVSESKSGVFDNPLVREAFVKVVPRQLIARLLAEDADAPVVLRDSFLFQPGEAGYAAASAAARGYLSAGPDVDAAIALLA
ncbi:MAG: ABC transporter substrate-binding protein, partial [Salinibacterium sp.]|nr:ABC transporter substrate-binding protein [Salinibacterium sp.]